MKYVFIFFMLFALKGYAQYPFEKFPVKKCDSVAFKMIGNDFDSTSVNYARYKDYTFKLAWGNADPFGGKILLYYKNKLIKSVYGDFGIMREADFPLYIEDVNGDGIPDFVFKTYSSGGAGLASSHVYNTWFIKKDNANFQVIKFESFYDKSERQYQFDRKGNSIIGQSLIYYKQHSYWLFDLYQYQNGKLVNVSKKYKYPIAVPYLNKETFNPTNKIPRAILNRFSMKQPDFNSVMDKY